MNRRRGQATSNSSDRVSGLAVLAGLVGGVALFSFASIRYIDLTPDELALGLNTVARTATHEGRPISGYGRDVKSLAATAEELREAGHEITLWIGASQLHAINKYEEGQELAIHFATRRATGRAAATRYVQVSAPNATYYDLLSSYVCFRQLGVTPDRLLVAITYDDFREEVMQVDTLDCLPEPRLPGTADERSQAPLPEPWAELVSVAGPGMRGLHDAHAEALFSLDQRSPMARNAITDTPQDRLEDLLLSGLESRWPAYRARNNFVAGLRVLNRKIVARYSGDIMSRSGGSIPADRLAFNMRALDAMLALAADDQVEVVLYRQPLRPGSEQTHYVQQEYEAFFRDLRARTMRDGFSFADFEKLVPEVEYWGQTVDGRADHFHYMEIGHRRLGEAIDRFLEQELR